MFLATFKTFSQQLPVQGVNLGKTNKCAQYITFKKSVTIKTYMYAGFQVHEF